MNKELATGWEVEWCDYVTRDEDGIDPDTARYRCRDFATKESAIAYAEKMLPKDVFGSVSVTHFYSEPYEEGLPACFREYDSTPEYVEA